jgi:hypothetical protein
MSSYPGSGFKSPNLLNILLRIIRVWVPFINKIIIYTLPKKLIMWYTYPRGDYMKDTLLIAYATAVTCILGFTLFFTITAMQIAEDLAEQLRGIHNGAVCTQYKYE